MVNTQNLLVFGSIVLFIVFSGCTGFGTLNEETTPSPEPTANITYIHTPESISTSTRTPTPTASPTDNLSPTPSNPNRSTERRKKYKEFDRVFKSYLHSDPGVELVNSSIYTKNETYTIYYRMGDPSNDTENILERQIIAFSYLRATKSFVGDDFPDRDHTWVPDRMNVTAITPDGRVYETAYVNYIWAYKYNEGLWPLSTYVWHYAGSIEGGPAGPEYDDAETDNGTT